ncbi:MAG: hypothetical protein PHN47_00495 [Clostridia bacterium]|nr:hypothetical protein [Clostridia bacterium]
MAELHLTDAEPAVLDEAYDFCRKVGLSTTLVEIGLNDLTYEDIYKIAVFAHEDSYMCHDGASITPKQIAAAIVMADKMGRVYKQPII